MSIFWSLKINLETRGLDTQLNQWLELQNSYMRNVKSDQNGKIITQISTTIWLND
jgi:hypothetical protein